MKDKILRQLMEATDYLSGEALSRLNGVSRTAVWKHIKKLKEEGYEILSVTNRGYKLQRMADGYNREEMALLLKDIRFLKDVRVYDTIDSTNQEAKRLGAEAAGEGVLLLSEEQTGGKGRRGRTWLSNKGDGIFMSLLLRPAILPIQASMLTLLAGLAVQRAVSEETGLDSRIKWPNDVVVGGRKVCGILTEMSTDMEEIQYVVVGIGVNVNAASMDCQAAPHGTSLAIEAGMTQDRKRIICAILKEFEALYNTFLESGSLDPFLDNYNRVCVNVGSRVRVEAPGGSYVAEALHMDNTGALVIRMDNGEVRQIHSGEISVRGLYGYVD